MWHLSCDMWHSTWHLTHDTQRVADFGRMTSNDIWSRQVWSTVRLKFSKSISGHHFQKIRSLAKNDFRYHREVINNIYQLILTKNVFCPHVRNFPLMYGPYRYQIDVYFGPVLMDFFLFFQMLTQFYSSWYAIRT